MNKKKRIILTCLLVVLPEIILFIAGALNDMFPQLLMDGTLILYGYIGFVLIALLAIGYLWKDILLQKVKRN